MWFRRWLDRLEEKRMARKYRKEVCKPLTLEEKRARMEWLAKKLSE